MFMRKVALGLILISLPCFAYITPGPVSYFFEIISVGIVFILSLAFRLWSWVRRKKTKSAEEEP